MKFSKSLSTLAVLVSTSVVLAACAPATSSNLPADDANTELTGPNESAPMPKDSLPLPTTPKVDGAQAEQILAGYQYLDPNHVVPTKLLEKAVVYFDQNKSRFANKNYIVVVDFSANSGKKRFFVIDMKTGAVASYIVAHGSGSDPDNDGNATRFSNRSGSNMSSLGFYRTAETYSGKHGYSLRIDGLSSTNSNVRARAVVVHGAAYSDTAWLKKYGHAGRSNGCFALAMSLKDGIINQIKGGALIYAGLSK